MRQFGEMGCIVHAAICACFNAIDPLAAPGFGINQWHKFRNDIRFMQSAGAWRP
jgi:hypothetical protein